MIIGGNYLDPWSIEYVRVLHFLELRVWLNGLLKFYFMNIPYYKVYFGIVILMRDGSIYQLYKM